MLMKIMLNYEFEIYDLFKRITCYILKYISNFLIDMKLKYPFYIVVIKYFVYLYCFMYKMIDFYIFNNYSKILNLGCIISSYALF